MKIGNYLVFVLLSACGSGEKSGIEVVKLSQASIDSIVNWSDSVVAEVPNGVEYAIMETYYQRGNPISKRILKDSLERIRAIIILKDGHYLQSKTYFANGQIKGKLSYSEPGVLHGPATYYYEDGRIRATGAFKMGKQWGEWKHFDEEGRLLTIEVYDEAGQLVKTKAE